MSLFSVFISSSHSPSLLYSICLYISLALSLLCLMSHISVSVCFCTSGLWSQIEHIILIYGVFFCFCIAPFTAAPPPPSPAIPLLLFLSFHTAQTMQFKKSWCNIMQTVREPPLEDSLLHLDTEPKAIWLELLRSGWSAVIFQPVQILFTLMAWELLPRKLELDEDWPELLYSTLCAFSSFF